MHILKRHAFSCLAAVAASLVAASPSTAQSSNVDLYFPTGEESSSLLMIRAEAPPEVRVGQQFEYNLTVRNITENVTLEDIRIRHDGSEYVSVEGSQVGQQGQQAQNQGQGQQAQNQGQQAQRQGGDNANVPVEERPQGQQAQQAQQGQGHEGHQGQQGQQGQGQQGQGEGIQIGELTPGQGKTVRIRAVAEQEGNAGVCFRVAYTPTVCLVTRITKPEIQVTKAVPERADICQPLRFRYTVTNTGTADVQNVVVSDDLPDGLQVEGGEAAIRREIGNLPAGETEEFDVELCALRTGRFTSRAVAQSGELRAQSNSPTTQVVAARLSTELEGPDAQYLNQPATYRVTVRNDGDGPALDTVLEVDVDERTRLIRTSRTSLNSVDPKQADDRTLTWAIGTLEPGQETAVSFTVNLNRVPQGAEARQPQGEQAQQGQQSEGSESYRFRHVAEVTSRCADAEMCADEEVRKYASASANLDVELVTLPALLLELVDRYDQVTVGENVDYVLTVINQGSGADNNVQLTVTLPDSLEYVSADGKTQAQNDGQAVTFQPIETLAPGEEARYEIIAKANRAGQISTNAELTSDFLQVPAREAEPTVLIGGEGATTTRSSNDQGQGQNNNQGQGNNNQGQGNNQNQGNNNQGSGDTKKGDN
ncbi:COG1361 family protein [Tautonia plasticadhaerens]|uniref:Large cysteine-rich periplasmic protein OmcB n=1 Tax=Tautonia plasticadhaerens TaxID=2527974 RepID=A0A518HDM4_9BACT|nr:DUF11 domain-containing protein [Tautonia plasticadhaerens]QDV38796.1 Large cysteine-rich periplasmic protein OmcB [Tautonia plasticadhaerens]